MEEAVATRAAPLRKKLERLLSKTQRARDKLARQRENETPATTELEILQKTKDQLEQQQTEYEALSQELYEVENNPTAIEEDEEKADTFDNAINAALKDCRFLISQRSIHSKIYALEAVIRGLTAAYESSPENDHNLATSKLYSKIKDLEKDLLLSLMTEEEELRGRGNQMLERAYATQGRVAGAKSSDIKPSTSKPSKSNVKLRHIEIPSFSGKTEDWLPFKRLFFKAVHNNDDLDDDTRLTYLVQAMQDKRVKAELAERLEEPGAYSKIIAELEAEHDKPRWMHRRYCDQLKNLQPNLHTREGMKQLISQVNSIFNGLTRLKGEDLKMILTSFTEGVIDPELRALWNQRSDSKKVTPPITELLQFINDQADQLEDESSTVPVKAWEKVKPRQGPKQRGAAHSAVSASPSQQRGSKPKTNQSSHGGASSTPSYSLCPVCQGGHPLFFCSTFQGYSVSQRKEKVMSLKLCLNCLKPNHVAYDCNSTFRCRKQDCGKKHNSLLHEDRSATSTAPHQTNAATHIEDQAQDEENEECLLMTAKVTLVGPTGKMMTVRALLDAGSTLSIISTKLMKNLSLLTTGKEVAISGIKSKGNKQSHPMTRVTLASEYQTEWKRDITVDEVIRQLPLQDAQSVRKMAHLQDLDLADDKFDRPGKVELLLGQNVWRHLFLDGRVKGSKQEDPEAWHTVFGWTVLGTYNPHCQTPTQQAITHMVASVEDNRVSDNILSRFQELEEPSSYHAVRMPTELKVEQHFNETHVYDQSQQRYVVKLPRKEDPPTLGESRTQAINRARSNERSLQRKGRLPAFQEVMLEYLTLNHARKITVQEHQSQPSYYMPVHSVVKASSTTTKVRAVFDASAKTTSLSSLNDILAVGPTLHPTIDKILLRFRLYPVAVSSDVSKMYREILLHPEDQPLHRYIWRESEEGPWQDYQMTRVTFGVAASPYLAVKVLQQAEEDHGGQHPKAQWHINHSFYVDDLLGGADTEEEAVELYQTLSTILGKANFHLRKWRSSSKNVLNKIPTSIQEPLPTQELVDQHSATYPKALGVAWDSGEDTMFTSINLPENYQATKRGVISDIARTFDVLGWISPVILSMKILYRELWQTKVDWDDQVSQTHEDRHREWREELPMLKDFRLPRCYFKGEKPTSIQLHGFSDASKEAFGAVIYLRATYPTQQPTVELVISKSKVAPLATRSIPQLELCGANLLAKLMDITRRTLDITLSDIWAYSDSTIILAWLDGQSKRYCIYSAHRIASTVALIPTKCWRHVPTKQNPADVVSRGVKAAELMEHPLWWHGPDWLATNPVALPVQPTAAHLAKMKEVEAKPEQVVLAVTQESCFEERQNSYQKLLRIVCWTRRFITFMKTKEKGPAHLTTAEGQIATNILLRRAQERSFPKEVAATKATPPKNLAAHSRILTLRPRMDENQLLRVGGRLEQSNYPRHQQHPIIISAKDHLTVLLFQHYHLLLGHCGPSTLMTHVANLYHAVGGRTLAKTICSRCIVCRK